MDGKSIAVGADVEGPVMPAEVETDVSVIVSACNCSLLSAACNSAVDEPAIIK